MFKLVKVEDILENVEEEDVKVKLAVVGES